MTTKIVVLVVWQEVANQALTQEFYNMDNSLKLGSDEESSLIPGNRK
jgi:hypothetical protein